MAKKLIPVAKLMKEITSYEAACAHLGRAAMTLKDFKKYPENQRQYAFSEHKLLTIHEVFHQNRKHDWNASVPKYYPWWDMETYNDGSINDGFSLHIVDFHFVITDVSSRLCSFSREEAEFIANTFIEDYRNIIKG